MAYYYSIPIEEMEEELESLRFYPVSLMYRNRPVKEWVYERKLPRSPNHFVRVYTGINRYGQSAGESRKAGKDAIRIQVIYRDAKGETLVSQTKRVHRVGGWRKNLHKRMNEVSSELPQVEFDSRGEPMTLRKKGKNQFWGSRDYPKYKETKPFRAEGGNQVIRFNGEMSEYADKNTDDSFTSMSNLAHISLPDYEESYYWTSADGNSRATVAYDKENEVILIPNFEVSLHMRGKKMAHKYLEELIDDAYQEGYPVQVIDVDNHAIGFWEKMQSQGLIEGWSKGSFAAEDDYNATYGVEQATIRRKLKNKIKKQAIMGTKAGQWVAHWNQFASEDEVDEWGGIPIIDINSLEELKEAFTDNDYHKKINPHWFNFETRKAYPHSNPLTETHLFRINFPGVYALRSIHGPSQVLFGKNLLQSARDKNPLTSSQSYLSPPMQKIRETMPQQSRFDAGGGGIVSAYGPYTSLLAIPLKTQYNRKADNDIMFDLEGVVFGYHHYRAPNSTTTKDLEMVGEIEILGGIPQENVVIQNFPPVYAPTIKRYRPSDEQLPMNLTDAYAESVALLNQFASEEEKESMDYLLNEIKKVWYSPARKDITDWVEHQMAGDGLLAYLDRLDMPDGSELSEDTTVEEYFDRMFESFLEDFQSKAQVSSHDKHGILILGQRLLYVPVGTQVNLDSLGNWEGRKADLYGVNSDEITSWLWSDDIYTGVIFGHDSIDHMEGEEGKDYDRIILAADIPWEAIDWASTIAFNISSHWQEKELCVMNQEPIYDLEIYRNSVLESERTEAMNAESPDWDDIDWETDEPPKKEGWEEEINWDAEMEWNPPIHDINSMEELIDIYESRERYDNGKLKPYRKAWTHMNLFGSHLFRINFSGVYSCRVIANSSKIMYGNNMLDDLKKGWNTQMPQSNLFYKLKRVVSAETPYIPQNKEANLDELITNLKNKKGWAAAGGSHGPPNVLVFDMEGIVFAIDYNAQWSGNLPKTSNWRQLRLDREPLKIKGVLQNGEIEIYGGVPKENVIYETTPSEPYNYADVVKTKNIADLWDAEPPINGNRYRESGLKEFDDTTADDFVKDSDDQITLMLRKKSKINKYGDIGCPVCGSIGLFSGEIIAKGKKWYCFDCLYEDKTETIKSRGDITLEKYGLVITCPICKKGIKAYNNDSMLRHMKKCGE